MGRPRLLCVMQMPPPVHGVTTINAQVAASALLGDHYVVEVVPLQFADSIDELRRVSIRKLVRAASVAGRLGIALMRRRPDLVYFTFVPDGPAFYRDCAYIALLKLFGVRRVYHLHAQGFSSHAASAWRRTLCRWAFSGAYAIVLASTLRDDTAPFIEDDRVFVVPNGVPGSPSRRRASDGVPRVLFLSNLIESKGPYVLLDALRELAARGCSFRAVFAGAPRGEAADFTAAIRRAGLTDHVEYVGPVYGERKDELFAQSDVFALPTWHDAFPLVVLEAMKWGLPVVSTPEGAIPEIVVEGETGFLVSRRDPVALANQLEVLLRDPALRSRMGSRARERFEAHYTLERFEQHLVAALERVQCAT
jgi:glycosyltransferase involved in cell wall biosynthesis